VTRILSRTLPTVVGSDLTVPLVDGGSIGYANLDHAAGAPCLTAVRDAVDELLPWCSSVHRGAGLASQVCTEVHEQAREHVRAFTGADERDAVVFTRNTTDALNLLARAVPSGASVVQFDSDHHAALLPWRSPWVHRLPAPASPEDAVAALDGALRRCAAGPRLVVLTAASNVTGELWPVAELTEVARRHGARVAVDAAQLAPHAAVSLRGWDADYVAISGHKLYAPFGAGALVGRADWLQVARPYLAGGGATERVVDQGDHLGVVWAPAPQRHEAGTPNLVGVPALATACRTLTATGWAAVAAHEHALLTRLRAGLATLPGVRELRLFGPTAPRVGIVSVAVDGHDPGLLAAALSAEYGIGVRDGAFCAHLAVPRLLATAGSTGHRALRAAVGLGTTTEHVDRFLSAMRALLAEGPRHTYGDRDGRWHPVPDPRPLPGLVD
jgi:selenocysteine lyase/cysteine desulfurase